MKKTPKFPHIPEEERTPLVMALLEIIHLQREQIQELRDEIARLKGQKPKPKIKPSPLEKPNSGKEKKEDSSKRPGSAKRKKSVPIDDIVILQARNVPKGSVFKGYEDFTVQDLLVRPYNTKYRSERWTTPDGVSIVANLPAEVRRHGSHFASSLQQFIIYQYCHCHVTQPLLLEQLRDLGVDISRGDSIGSSPRARRFSTRKKMRSSELVSGLRGT
jgi:hypothetical protein